MSKKRKINWPAYNKQLVNRGSLTFLFSEDVAHNWYNTSPKGSGFQRDVGRYGVQGIKGKWGWGI